MNKIVHHSFSDMAVHYDLIYYNEDVYAIESLYIRHLLKKYKKTPNMNLLDAACGTGTHVKFFSPPYTFFGLDNSEAMLALAKEKYPENVFFCSNMVDFKIDLKFGVILCLYGSIGFVQTFANLQKTIANFNRHLEAGGILILVPWALKENLEEGIISDRVISGGKHVVRIEHIKKSDPSTVTIEYNILIGDNKKVTYYKGTHPAIGLFSKEEYIRALDTTQMELVEHSCSRKIRMGQTFVCRKKL